MRLKRLEIFGFKSFAKKAVLEFNTAITSVVGPNGSGKSNVAEAIRFVLGEQSMKSMRGKRGEDLIFNGSKTMGRMGKASVSIVFDNHAREFQNIDFDEVIVTREVSRDGTNEYFINGSQVRLRDVLELLSYARIGASGHHIISQGEADRVLTANQKDRREMIEDALGLRVYQYKRAEAERKLEKTEENIKEAESLRREIAPHIKFLRKQMEKIKEGEDLRQRLTGLYREYLKREEVYINERRKRLATDREEPQRELQTLDARIAEIRAQIEKTAQDDEGRRILLSFEEKLRMARREKDATAHTLGKLEGMIESEERRLAKLRERDQAEKVLSIKSGDFKNFVDNISREVEEAERTHDVGLLHSILGRLKQAVHDFFSHHKGADATDTHEAEAEVARLRGERDQRREELGHAEARLLGFEAEMEESRRALEAKKEESREGERQLYGFMSRRGELSLKLEKLAEEERGLEKLSRDLEIQLQEAGVMIGRAVLDYSQTQISIDDVMQELRDRQDERRREIERAKIKLEDLGVLGAEEVAREFQETTERDQFLEKELLDLAQSAEALERLIVELNEKLEIEFKDGLGKINKQFRDFFGLMFGGGVAELQVVDIQKRKKSVDDEGNVLELPEDEDEEAEQGIEIHVSLPHKKIRGLQMLSGGERALTSIALLFAISQVNPPPFMVLDETDAALDEANSRKYGDMLESLAKLSQIVVITHNRETMGRAGILYGVTMGSDAVSKLLSIQFEEAVLVAK
jgi:chromosome segregation protein